MRRFTRSKSVYLHNTREDGWGHALAQQIDQAIDQAGSDRDVISVAVAPLATSLTTGGSPTVGVIVTVIWSEPEGPQAS